MSSVRVSFLLLLLFGCGVQLHAQLPGALPVPPAPPAPPPPPPPSVPILQLEKLDPLLQRAAAPGQRFDVILRARDAAALESVALLIQESGGTVGRRLSIIDAVVANVANETLPLLTSTDLVTRIALDRRIAGTVERTGATIGATLARQEFGYDGAGITVTVIDSGVTSWHDDLIDAVALQRVDEFVDFVHTYPTPYDDNGHGTHVAGIIAGNGFDSSGARTGIAPAVRLSILKVLDASGRGRISNVIAAFDHVLAHRDVVPTRVINVSVAAGVYESYHSDLLTLAAKRVVEAGIVVVAAAGNFGRRDGQAQYGWITAPGNAPWVLTVGAASHAGTADRVDDSVAGFSSRGPTAFDRTAKPDLVAPGVGIESLSDHSSAMYTSRSAYLLDGTITTAYRPYLSLSGTSQAAPVVTGTVALMLQAAPALTPNAVKAILEYTAQPYGGYDALTQGVGFLNAHGAIELARFFAAPSASPYPVRSEWSQQLFWGNYRVSGGRLTTDANAWSSDVIWGASPTASAGEIVWGVRPTAEPDGAWTTWGATCVDPDCHTLTSSDAQPQNVVWGTSCSGADCPSGTEAYAASDTDTVVWGTTDSETVVWGTNGDEDTVVWGTTGDEDTVVWGTPCEVEPCQ